MMEQIGDLDFIDNVAFVTNNTIANDEEQAKEGHIYFCMAGPVKKIWRSKQYRINTASG